MELALALDRRTWYNLYERNTIEKFTELYWKENGIGGWEQHKIIPDRLYIGNASVSYTHLDVYKRQVYDLSVSWYLRL